MYVTITKEIYTDNGITYFRSPALKAVFLDDKTVLVEDGKFPSWNTLFKKKKDGEWHCIDDSSYKRVFVEPPISYFEEAI